MEDWVHRALARWPNVPALYGWLALDRRGRWLIRGEVITRHQIIDTINSNYACDERGCWYFQNGPQRGYIRLDYTPLVLRADSHHHLDTHTGRRVESPTAAYLDEQGALVLATEHGVGVIDSNDLEWALTQLRGPHGMAGEADLDAALVLPSGTTTALHFVHVDIVLPVLRLDAAQMPHALGFVRDPQPNVA